VKRRCPIDQLYGGLPSTGNYEPHTEYEIGAARMAEAAHCILGSLHRGADRAASKTTPTTMADAMSVERAHIVEELQLIEKIRGEYSKQLYSDRLLPENIIAESWIRDEYRQNALASAQASVDHIKENSPKLQKLALTKKNDLEHCPEELPSYVMMLAYAAYEVVEELAYRMVKSVEYYPHHVRNAFRSRGLARKIAVLRMNVDRFLKETEGLWYEHISLETPIVR
jgi:hypothetical protein